MTDPFVSAAFLLLAVFVVLAAVDGLYLHLHRLRLHARPECRREHALHTARAVLFVPILLLLYAQNRGGAALLLGVGIAALDTFLEAADAASEPASRRALGGLGAAESLLHVVLVTLRTASLVLLLVAKPAGAFAPNAPALLQPGYGVFEDFVAKGLLGGAVATAALHAWLLLRRGAPLPAPAPRG